MNKFYTKKGDKRFSVFGARPSSARGYGRVKKFAKDSVELEAFGELDELTSLLGVIKNQPIGGKFKKIIGVVQNDLSAIQGNVAAVVFGKTLKTPEFGRGKVADLERLIDKVGGDLKPLKGFVVPGENLASAWLDLARAVCRRAERSAVKLAKKREIPPRILAYLNRLSSLLFVMARLAERKLKLDE